MILIKTYQDYIIKSFLKYIFIIFGIFTCLIFILNVLEELKFFENSNLSIFYPIFLTLLNTPSLIFEIFPFIFLLSTQMLFIKLYDKKELDIFKNFGLTNFKIIKVLLFTSLIFGLIFNTVFYTFSSKLKNNYLSFKNNFTNDNKYLAIVNENGLWIKDEINNKINIINADEFIGNQLNSITITQLDKNFNLKRTIISDSANINNNNWELKSVEIFEYDGKRKKKELLYFETNFNKNKIESLFSNLSSLNFLQLKELYNDYKSVGYSTSEVEGYLNKLYSYPIYLMIMTIIGSILMLHIKNFDSKIFNIVGGILFSVIVYYINYFFGVMGDNGKLPIILSIWLPLLILIIICSIGLVTINEK